MCPGTIVYISLRPGTLYVPGTLLYHRFLRHGYCKYGDAGALMVSSG
jgi:hypothetical protein